MTFHIFVNFLKNFLQLKSSFDTVCGEQQERSVCSIVDLSWYLK